MERATKGEIVHALRGFFVDEEESEASVEDLMNTLAAHGMRITRVPTPEDDATVEHEPTTVEGELR